MANKKQLAILKQGTHVWNKWRSNNLTKFGLWEIDLSGADLGGAKLGGADLGGVDLSKANLCGANLGSADLIYAKLYKANLSDADLGSAYLCEADLRNVNLSRAVLLGSDLSQANLSGAKLYEADLNQANLSGAKFSNANFKNAIFGDTLFGAVDLSKTIGLDEVDHSSSSTVGANTMSFSKGKIPEAFLRGCGLSDWEIEAAKLYDPSLSNQEMDEILYRVHDMRANQPIQVSPLFISYSHNDNKFVDKLERHLNKRGVRFWRDVHDATSGKLEKQIDRAIRHNPTVLVILSKNSTKSDWVQHEVRVARQLEEETGRDVLCPVALDDGWKASPWPKRVMEQVMEYNILDFSKWNDDESFKNMFVKLIDGLNLYYKK